MPKQILTNLLTEHTSHAGRASGHYSFKGLKPKCHADGGRYTARPRARRSPKHFSLKVCISWPISHQVASSLASAGTCMSGLNDTTQASGTGRRVESKSTGPSGTQRAPFSPHRRASSAAGRAQRVALEIKQDGPCPDQTPLPAAVACVSLS